VKPPLPEAYARLRARFGHRGWWPGESPFEVCVGAILVQNTAWRNVERALSRLRADGLLDPRRLHALPEAELAERIRPAGCFRVKARRLRAFLDVLVREFGGELARLFAGETAAVRARLLVIHGLGPETADSLLLYAGGHARFVVDAYLRRVFTRHGWVPATPRADPGYAEWQEFAERALAATPAAERLDLWSDFHAQLVAVGQAHCRKAAPSCAGCPLESLLPR
jgi:endonuclease III related protein